MTKIPALIHIMPKDVIRVATTPAAIPIAFRIVIRLPEAAFTFVLTSHVRICHSERSEESRMLTWVPRLVL
jgi:hypothetical protein